ncbi:uncharacterized protein LOC111351810 [Spodoptera litura]|uniref:Uncharacterized protein LOC111351810 n=1 Tax=Spodoptera litura TaxID=69820 RepID=A0A9J7DYN0_SPOLT|nr:uncharacterized protein LOC111351810 [Spodoptera litura]
MADSNSNSYDNINNYSPKIEVDSESEREYLRRDQNTKCKLYWTTENTIKLIETMEKECRELWDPKNPLNRDRNTRQAKFEYLAEVIGTTSEEISRKVHNLRTQFNNELRKIKRGQVVRSGWEYFDALSFLMRTPSAEALETVDAVNLELAEFQADEEEEFGAAARAHVALLNASNNSANGSPSRRLHRPLRVAASAPLPLPPSANPLMWPEEPTPRIRPGINADECQIFGDFVASELRTLRSHESRKRLKRMIQKAILQIGEEEDVNMISG